MVEVFPHRQINPAAAVMRKACFSFAAYACNVISHLKKCNVPISKGLSDEEFQHIQSTFGFTFPPDLRSILQEGLPVGSGFPNWRLWSDKQLMNMIKMPIRGICQEVYNGTFWWHHWGPRPVNSDEAVHVARKALQAAPTLVPIYSHCYIPCNPCLAGNPVFLVYKNDVFYCGYDLADFFEREVFVPLYSAVQHPDLSLRLQNSGFDRLLGVKANMRSINEDVVIEPQICNGFSERHDYKLDMKEVQLELLNQRLLEELQNGRQSDCALLSRKSLCEETLHAAEKPPKSLVRSAGSSPRMAQKIISRYAYFNEQPLPLKIRAQLTIAAPPWAAKKARHIPVWSDLVENKENVQDWNLMVMQDLDLDHRKEMANETKQNGMDASLSSKRWLGDYFKNVEITLREGGWKEEEIKEMIVGVMPSCNLNKQTHEALIKKVDALSLSLQKVGWTVQDAIDILNIDIHSNNGYKPCNGYVNDKAVSHVMLTKKKAKLGEFLAYT